MPDLDPDAILGVLNQHGVEYVVIGAWAAIAQGAPIGPTADIDITPSRAIKNLDRLSSALTELDAKIRVDAEPEGTDGYDDLIRNAITVEIGGGQVRLAHLADVIRSKEAAGRPKDLSVLPALIAHLRSLE